MNILDINPVTRIVTPAKPEVEWPLLYITKLLTEGLPPAPLRVYAELRPYRRITQDLPFEVTPAVPVLDSEGQPVLNEGGTPQMTEAVVEMRPTVVGGECKPDCTAEEIIVIDLADITPMIAVDPVGEALIGQTVMTFAAQGGNILAMGEACILLSVKQVAIAQGKVTA